MSFDSEVFANLASNWFCLHSDRLILLFDLDFFAFWLSSSIDSREGDVNINGSRKDIGCHGYCYDSFCFVKSINDTVSQDIKGAAKQDIIGGGSKDMNLQIKHDVTKGAGNITS